LKRLKLGIIGTRGVPPRYGGFETFVAELGRRLAARGHSVVIYSRRVRDESGGGSQWEGVERVELPSISHKYLETVSHTLISTVDALRRGFDAVLVCNAANAFVLPLLRAARVPVAINVDGIERRRRKWNILGRAVYAAGESFSVIFASRIVADAEVIAAYYRTQYGVGPLTIPYGSAFPEEPDSDVLERLGVKKRGYVLYVSRFEPENNPLPVVLAYERMAASVSSDVPPLVMVGDGLYAPDLVAELRRHEGPRVLFPGALYGTDYRTLQRHAGVYIQATEVGGTHPALIEAMASGGNVLAYATSENEEVGGDAVRYFRLGQQETLSRLLRECLDGVSGDEPIRNRARRRAADHYDWERVTDAYEALFRDFVSAR
jgi:glycosyltransferase involved in cell wall biosynthesis